MPNTDLADAERLLDRIRYNLLDARPVRLAPDFRYTVSIGITAIQPGDSARSVLSRADKACYEAKRRGRDRSVSL